jgi:bifunctional DNase/RNase
MNDDQAMIRVRVDKLSLSKAGFVVLLRGIDDPRTLPVFIGPAEAQAIAIKIDDLKVPRPLTHDLLRNVLESLEWRVSRIEVHDLVDNTFYGRLVLESAGRTVEVDSRPSDAIALAMRCGAPMYVSPTVMEQAASVEGHAAEKPKQSPLELLKSQLERAVTDERYEDAARIRDEIKRAEATPSN